MNASYPTLPLPSLTKYPISILLIDDQIIVAEAIRRMLDTETDIAFHYCQDPSKAIEMASKVKPTVILQDLVMPDMDGLTLVRYFRANPVTQDIPLIVLSVKEDPKIKAESLALGANDYLVKIPDKIELIARLRYHSKAYTLLLQRNEAYEKMLESQRALVAELAEAGEYVKSQLPQPINNGVDAKWKFIPSMQLGGDAFSYHWLDEDHFVIYLLDVCGHGVGAALLSVTIMNVLNSNTLTNVDLHDPAQVLMALNNMFLMEKHNNMFFTMWYGVYSKKKRELVYSGGGHPPAILMTGDHPDQMNLKKLESKGLVVGGMPNTQYTNDSCAIGKYNKLFVFSDGVFEICHPDKTMNTFDNFVNYLEKLSKENSNDDVELITTLSRQINLGTPFPDDYSLLRFIFK